MPCEKGRAIVEALALALIIGETARQQPEGSVMSEPVYEKYELRGGSNSFRETHLIQEVEAASIEDIKWHLSQTCPGEPVWIVNTSRNTKPFMVVPMKLGSSPITPNR